MHDNPPPFGVRRAPAAIVIRVVPAIAVKAVGDHRRAEQELDLTASHAEVDLNDVLVVETTGSNDSTWLDRSGNYHTNALKVTERFTVAGENHLQYSATIEDANVFTRPWTISMPLYRHTDANAQILEFKCVPFVEELLYKDLELPAQR